MRIPTEEISESLLALLDDDTFRVFDLLGHDEDNIDDFKLLTEAQKKWFSPSTSKKVLHFHLGVCEQGPEEMNMLMDLLTSPTMPTLNWMSTCGWSSLMTGLLLVPAMECIQRALLQSPPDTLDGAWKTAQ